MTRRGQISRRVKSLRFPANIKKFLLVFLCLVFSTCGIEDYPFLHPVPAGNITVEMNSKATISLHTSGEFLTNDDAIYFTHFTIYYRIYLSNSLQAGSINNVDLMRTVNPTLASDYSAFLPYTSNENSNASASTSTLFSGRSYRSIAVAGYTIESDVLDNTSWGHYISLDFTQTAGNPTLNILGSQPYSAYILLRSNGSGLFTPRPVDRYFLNTTELNSSTNASTTINADVVDVSSPTGGARYAYVALYIVVTGIDGNFSPIYSAPTFIGVLRLP
jgi:hypothetical protein